MADAEALRLEDSEDDFKYEEVDVMSDGDDDASEDLDAALRKLQAFTTKEAGTARARTPEVQPGQVVKKPEVIDDFMRNFFIKMGLARTCECFEAEWYELKATGRLDNSTTVPDVYLRNAELEDEVSGLRRELSEAKSIASRASATWDKFRKERDFHRMHHKRVAQEKNKLLTDLRRLKEHYAKYEPTILELKKKYETLMKEKMMASLERDKLASKVEALEAAGQERSFGAGSGASGVLRAAAPPANGALSASAGAAGPAAAAAAATASAGPRSGWASLNAPARRNPYVDLEFPPAPVKMLSLAKTFKGHLLSVANMALHPTKPILVTASDDKTWKMWHMPGGDLIMCGEGHKDWVAGVDFHPAGTCLASGGGDTTVKIWDFEKQRCAATFTDHKQAIWAVRFHHLGEVVASGSLDHTVELSGHEDAVQSVLFDPAGQYMVSCGSDNTFRLWS
ncbi:Flagellar WD repeat domain-containing protein [Tetrabaena socialis]|uniref:Flagellar WD repeat domain-containing protein n=1 Tax=Tetrabaena socialis TaxID=47790 RepID=A0A2J8A6L2_9CHLO|nr:Flagellar WD repeat domain-containing protein [Tetrabaena socialis]|eukprot:PNH08137.1 Flagellar WD repeat domain-containing protein [Tetrabaena socialis]